MTTNYATCARCGGTRLPDGISITTDLPLRYCPTPAASTGPDKREAGLYGKFRVERNDGKSAEGEKHHGCEYFVLDLDHDPFALPALYAYEQACAGEYPVLARDLATQRLTMVMRGLGPNPAALRSLPREGEAVRFELRWRVKGTKAWPLRQYSTVDGWTGYTASVDRDEDARALDADGFEVETRDLFTHPAAREDSEGSEPPELHGSYATKIILELVRDGEYEKAVAADSQSTYETLNEALAWAEAEYAKVRAARAGGRDA